MVPITQHYPRRNSGAWNLVGYPRLTVAGGVAEAITTKSASSFSTPDGQPCRCRDRALRQVNGSRLSPCAPKGAAMIKISLVITSDSVRCHGSRHFKDRQQPQLNEFFVRHYRKAGARRRSAMGHRAHS